MTSAKQNPSLVFQYWQSALDQMWYWHLKTETNEKVAQGEIYATKAGCLQAIERVKRSGDAPVDDLTAGP